jgi:hypothetical protein
VFFLIKRNLLPEQSLARPGVFETKYHAPSCFPVCARKPESITLNHMT